MLNLIKKFIPKKIFTTFQPWYHFVLAKLAPMVYAYPSNKMLVVGVTGTAGKSSSCYFVAQILESAGFKVGMTTTTLFKIGKKEWLNDKKMTMLGRLKTQKLLRQMVRQQCQVAVVEATSQGIGQYRHLGINWDILVFTNLYPEHIEAHDGFENYKKAKGKLFAYLSKRKNKNIREFKQIKKTIVANLDDEHAGYFLDFKAEKKITYAIQKNADVKLDYKINLLGNYNKYNVLVAVTVAKSLDISDDKIRNAVANLKPLPGRLEFIENDLGIKILVDYAFEPKAVEKLYQTIKEVEHNKVIHILGSAGGGSDPATQRDKARRPLLGKLANDNAGVVVVTNEDPYDEDSLQIINEVAAPVAENKLHKILDRRQAIKKALTLAQKDDLILITGKGAEQKICLANGKMMDWDDRRVVREELKKV